MALGTVKWFDRRKGFGFLTDQDGRDLFVHHTGLADAPREQMLEGRSVSFDVAAGEKGPKAVNVRLVDASSPPPPQQA